MSVLVEAILDLMMRSKLRIAIRERAVRRGYFSETASFSEC